MGTAYHVPPCFFPFSKKTLVQYTLEMEQLDLTLSRILKRRLQISQEMDSSFRGTLEDPERERMIIAQLTDTTDLRPEYLKKIYETIFWETKFALYSDPSSMK